MELVQLEEYIDVIHSDIKRLLKSVPKISGWSAYFEEYESEVYTYMFNAMTRYDQPQERNYKFISTDRTIIFSLNECNIEYINNNEVIKFDINISEEWHFQQMTVKPLIAYNSVLKVREIYEIVKKR
jgi:hypothetical protein